ncbi:alpha/beta fold hydrolase [Oceanobacillus oncorhynchi]|uniref:alpha/beta fold hydrolase n=1 Tax=Oceanobacillus oncorhynchi TaxID=545501 RepID=UPI003B0116A5
MIGTLTIITKKHWRLQKKHFFRVMFENMSFSIPEGFETARSRILVLIGKKENSIIKKSMADILERNENCLGVVISGVGHVPLYNPTYFNELIEDLIKKEKIPNDAIRFNAS